ncbi:hypothetical protein J8273_0579 [Carpediemonas membranifera]|uniref:Uncharacterized protein n=1 Tax=Carpediemonas membranifera TaxID=201153 RepID=A0A8J6AVM8_9EUKA|nr:hypothetical protein J8273_0579 [Carpediemonas membranifera]|eukprot:KAG9395338.1 hypothetical protein J8273_0579 [Carpediemonas membranifera]
MVCRPGDCQDAAGHPTERPPTLKGQTGSLEQEVALFKSKAATLEHDLAVATDMLAQCHAKAEDDETHTAHANRILDGIEARVTALRMSKLDSRLVIQPEADEVQCSYLAHNLEGKAKETGVMKASPSVSRTETHRRTPSRSISRSDSQIKLDPKFTIVRRALERLVEGVSESTHVKALDAFDSNGMDGTSQFVIVLTSKTSQTFRALNTKRERRRFDAELQLSRS